MLIIRRFAYRGTELVVVPQPDNSIPCIPAWMTQQSAAQYGLCAEPQFSLEVLRSLRAEINALLAALCGRPVRGNRYFHFHGKFCRAFCLSRPTKPPLYKDPVVNIGCV